MNLFFFKTASTDDSHTVDDNEVDMFDTDEDNESVASFETAIEDLDLYEDCVSTDNEDSVTCSEWSSLIQKYGSRPGVLVSDANHIEAFDMYLSTKTRAEPIVAERSKIEEFSGAALKFMHCQNSYHLGLRIEASLERAYYAIKACDAVIADAYERSRIIWVTMKVEGPQLLQTVAELRDGLQHVLPKERFTNDDALHMTAACIRLERRSDWSALVEKVAVIAKLLNEAYEKVPLIGHLGEIGHCKSGYIAVRPVGSSDPINRIVLTIRQLLRDEYGFELIKPSKPHMTLFTSAKRAKKIPDFNRNMFQVLGLSLDLGMVRVSDLQVSRSVPSLGGKRYITLASYPIRAHTTAV